MESKKPMDHRQLQWLLIPEDHRCRATIDPNLEIAATTIHRRWWRTLILNRIFIYFSQFLRPSTAHRLYPFPTSAVGSHHQPSSLSTSISYQSGVFRFPSLISFFRLRSSIVQEFVFSDCII